MSLNERRANLVEQINQIGDEQTIEMLEEMVAFYTHSGGKDITDGLSEKDHRELKELMEEPAEKDTITHEEFKKIFAKWYTK